MERDAPAPSDANVVPTQPLDQETIDDPESGVAEDSLEGAVRDAVKRRLFGGAPAFPSTIGRYTVLEELGRGGLGVVYSAFDPELDRKVAIKLVRADRRASEGGNVAQERLLREAQAIARLSHPNVVQVYDAGTFEDQVFVAMEFVRGQTLRDWLGRELHQYWYRPQRRDAPALVRKTRVTELETPRPWARVLEVMVDAGRGLEAAHEAGLVHRDFKPDNVMIDMDGRAHVLDFGLARPADGATRPARRDFESEDGLLDQPLTMTGAIVGTPAYMAPEQFEGGATDSRTDQFAFCVTLYEALYGERPFAGASIGALCDAVMAGKLRGTPKSDVPAAVHDAIVRGLAVEREQRHRSMTHLLRKLDHQQAARRPRGRWFAAAGIVGVAATGVAIASAADGDVCSTPGFATIGDGRAADWSEDTHALWEEHARVFDEARSRTCRDPRAHEHVRACLAELRADALAVADALHDGRTAAAAGGVAALTRVDVCTSAPSRDNKEPMDTMGPSSEPSADPRVLAAMELAADQPGSATTLVREAVESADPRTHPVAHARALIASATTDPEAGPTESLTRAAELAGAHRRHDVESLAWILLAEASLDRSPREALALTRAAEVAARRAGRPPSLVARTLGLRATALERIAASDDGGGDSTGTAPHLDQAVELRLAQLELLAQLAPASTVDEAAVRHQLVDDLERAGRPREAQRWASASATTLPAR